MPHGYSETKSIVQNYKIEKSKSETFARYGHNVHIGT